MMVWRILLLAAAGLPALLVHGQSVNRAGRSASSSRTLRLVADVPLPGPAVRFDYQSLDTEHGRLYVSHMDADALVVLDVRGRDVAAKLVANLPGFKRVHGVLAVPEEERVFASVTGQQAVAMVDMQSLKTLQTVGPAGYADGLAWVPGLHRLFVSDEHGGVDTVIAVNGSNVEGQAQSRVVARIVLGGGAGNTVFDPGSGHVLVAVHGLNQLVAIDPGTMKIVARYALQGVDDPHGIALDEADRLAFVAGEGNHMLAAVDLKTGKELGRYAVGDDPDVLAFDPGVGRLYVSAESGMVTVFALEGAHGQLREIDRFTMPHAHTVSVDPQTHRVYFPLQDVGGRPVMRVMQAVP